MSTTHTMLTRQPNVSLLYALATAFANCESLCVKPHTSGSDCHTLVKNVYTNCYMNTIEVMPHYVTIPFWVYHVRLLRVAVTTTVYSLYSWSSGLQGRWKRLEHTYFFVSNFANAVRMVTVYQL